MKKYVLDLKVVSVEALSDKHVLIKLTDEKPLPEILPGQFVEVRVDHSPTTMLRRPISINFVDRENNQLWLLVAMVGDGTRQLGQLKEGERNSFMFSLLVLSSYIINADGKIMHSEMEMVRRFLRQNFGEAAKQQGEEILLKLFEQQKQMGMQQYRSVIQDSCHQIRSNMMYEQRLQLLNFLVMIAQADGVVNSQEIQALKEMAIHMGLSAEDVDQMLNLESGASSTGSLDDAYRVLGISPDASNDEVKAAYRKMALKHHPDKVAALGEDVRRAAEKKFQEINDAKDRIYKARGI